MDIVLATNANLLVFAELICVLKQELDLPDRGVYFDLDAKSLPQAAYLIQRAEASQGFVLLVVRGERAVGMLIASRKTRRGGASSLELTLVIEQGARRQGCGEALLRDAERLAPFYGTGALTLAVLKDNLPAIRFYQKMGFDEDTEVFIGEHEENQDTDKLIRMIKTVGLGPSGSYDLF